MNIVILMAAGVDNFFKDKNYRFPKPLVEINNKTIAQHVVNSIESFIQRGDKIIFVVRKDDNDKYYLNKTLKLLAPNSIVISIPGQTAGGAISALLSIEEVNELDPLLIMNGDQIIEDDLLKLTNNFINLEVDAGTLVFNSVHPRWSYIKCDKEGYVIEAAEKKPISNLATAGFYYYKIARDYFESAKKMILKDSHVDGQFYVCPVFNEIILNGKKIGVYKIEQNKYHSLMTEEMIKQYEEYLINLNFMK